MIISAGRPGRARRSDASRCFRKGSAYGFVAVTRSVARNRDGSLPEGFVVSHVPAG
jgi:hypothetical protein